MMMDQLQIIFNTLQGMNSTDEAEIGLDPNLLPLKDVTSLLFFSSEPGGTTAQ